MSQATEFDKQLWDQLIDTIVRSEGLSAAMAAVYHTYDCQASKPHLTKALLMAALLHIDPVMRKQVKRCAQLIQEKRSERITQLFSSDFPLALDMLNGGR